MCGAPHSGSHWAQRAGTEHMVGGRGVHIERVACVWVCFRSIVAGLCPQHVFTGSVHLESQFIAYVVFLHCRVGGLALLVEKKSRRMELALYVLSR